MPAMPVTSTDRATKAPRISQIGSSDFDSTASATPVQGGTCIVLHPDLKARRQDTRRIDAKLDEAVGLARAIDLNVVYATALPVDRPRPATLLGSGTVERIGRVIHDAGESGDAKNGGGITVVIVDGIVSPVQQRNLERAWQCKVIDRTGLILEIFGARARTKEGRLQVELAALTYQRSRLVRSWTHLERQRGGFGFMGGPGETQIEADRRMIGERITRLKRDLKDVARTRGLHRSARQRVPYPVVALVGYTNAGKSTLFNRLTQAAVPAKDLLFATLDPAMRGIDLPSGLRIILSDTVGFISDLPHELVAAFRATLEEVAEADVIVHVRDASHSDSDAQREDVHRVLGEMGLGAAVDAGMVELLNKIDLIAPERRDVLINQAARAPAPVVPLSAISGEGCKQLLAVLDGVATGAWQVVDMVLAPEEGALLAWLYEHGRVIERRDGETGIALKVSLAVANLARFERLRRRERHPGEGA